MKKISQIELYTPGIVIFDPAVLAAFIDQHQIVDTNLFRAFSGDERLGRLAIEEGVVLPIYEIPENSYSIFISTGNNLPIANLSIKFSYNGFPLKIESGILITADLNALFDWDYNFFNSYLDNYDKRLASNDYVEAQSGLYDVSISGYSGEGDDISSLAYGLYLLPVNSLPEVGENKAVDDFNFSLY